MSVSSITQTDTDTRASIDRKIIISNFESRSQNRMESRRPDKITLQKNGMCLFRCRSRVGNKRWTFDTMKRN